MLKWTAFLGANKVPSQLWPIMSPMSRTLSGLTQMLGWIEFLGPNKVPLQLRPTMSTCHVHWTHLNSLHIPLVWKNSTQIISSPELALWNELPGIGFTIADLRDDYWSWVNTCYNYLMVLCSISGFFWTLSLQDVRDHAFSQFIYLFIIIVHLIQRQRIRKRRRRRLEV